MQETVYLPTGGSIPGIPGGALGAGTYAIDWDVRIATPIIPDQSIEQPAETPKLEETPSGE